MISTSSRNISGIKIASWTILLMVLNTTVSIVQVPHGLTFGIDETFVGPIAVQTRRPLGTRVVLFPADVAVPVGFHIPGIGIALPGIHAPAAVDVVMGRGDHTTASDAVTQDGLRCMRFWFPLRLDLNRFRRGFIRIPDLQCRCIKDRQNRLGGVSRRSDASYGRLHRRSHQVCSER